MSFKLFNDKDIGFSSQHEKNLTECRQDDDVDTDEDVYDVALKACSRDFNSTRDLMEERPLNQMLNNFDLKKRVEQPENFDRNGKFIV